MARSIALVVANTLLLAALPTMARQSDWIQAPQTLYYSKMPRLELENLDSRLKAERLARLQEQLVHQGLRPGEDVYFVEIPNSPGGPIATNNLHLAVVSFVPIEVSWDLANIPTSSILLSLEPKNANEYWQFPALMPQIDLANLQFRRGHFQADMRLSPAVGEQIVQTLNRKRMPWGTSLKNLSLFLQPSADARPSSPLHLGDRSSRREILETVIIGRTAVTRSILTQCQGLWDFFHSQPPDVLRFINPL